LRRADAPRAVLRGHYGGVSSVAFSPAAQTLAAGWWDKAVKLWTLPLADRVLQAKDLIYSIAYSRDGKTLAAGSKDGIVNVWELDRATTGSPCRLEGHTDSVRSVAFRPDGQMLASGSYDRTVRLWNVSQP